MTASIDQNKQLLSAFIQEVWNEGNSSHLEQYLAPAYTLYHDPGDPWDGQTLDRAGFEERLRISRAPFPDQRFEIQALVAEGDAVVMTWLWRGTHRADMPGFPATGKVVRMSGATLYRFEDGRLRGHWQITDRLGVYQQLMANAKA